MPTATPPKTTPKTTPKSAHLWALLRRRIVPVVAALVAGGEALVPLVMRPGPWRDGLQVALPTIGFLVTGKGTVPLTKVEELVADLAKRRTK